MKVSLVTLCSGGLDSVTLVYLLKKQGYHQELLFVDYGQRHLKEEVSALRCARDLDLEYSRVEIHGSIFDSALTTPSIPVPSGEYTPETLSTLVVPNRNAIFANLAAALAVSRGFDGIAMAMHGGDHEVYPDCRPVFIEALEKSLLASTNRPLKVETPFILITKARIVDIGMELEVPYGHTWSCYKGGEKHCGICPTCRERQLAFYGYTDPTEYEVSLSLGE